MSFASLAPFLSGAITMGFLVGSAFFLRFWRRTGDALFAAFAVAFLLLGTSQALTTLLNAPLEERTWMFLLRLAAFSLLIVAILQKNLRPRS